MSPTVSIIVPTHNRRVILSSLLDALCAQTYPHEKMEVIIVADGCEDDTADFVRHYGDQAPLSIRLHEQEGMGPAAARNQGAALARGQILIFLDDDIEATPQLVAAHVTALRARRDTVAIGPLPLVIPDNPTFFHKTLHDWWEGEFFKMRQAGYRFAYHNMFSGNFSLSAELFRRVDGFDTRLRCHEDYEFGYRLIEAGASFHFASDAVGYHHDRTDVDRSLQRRRAEGEADVYLAQRYPILGKRLPMMQGPFSPLSRGLRYLAFKQPKVGDTITRLLRRGLDILESAWLYGFWQQTLHHLQDYWYWRGVAGEVGSPRLIQQLVASFDKLDEEDPEPPELIIDLAQGLKTGEKLLDTHRPASVALAIESQLVGEISPDPGMERLRGAHLRAMMATRTPSLPLTARAAQGDAYDPGLTPPLIFENHTPLSLETYLYKPKKIGEVEVTKPIAPLDSTGYQCVQVLVRYHGEPLGWITLENGEKTTVTADMLREEIRIAFGWDLLSQTLGRSLRTQEKVAATQPAITVVVCTRDRTAQLRGCLRALLNLDYPDYEILVVDNAPSDEKTAVLASDLPVRYVREARPGLDWARNRGVAEATHEIIAFTDDDARPDAGWLQSIAQAFAEPEVMAVTGPVLPAELDTTAQNLFEFGYGGMGHGFRRRFVRRRELSPTELLWASSFGVGANMAFRRSLFADVGDFDVALDVGAPSRGGGDVEMFHRLVAHGHTLVYEPNALVWHQHRREDADLEKLVADNGRSFGCYLLTCARNRTVGKATILLFFLYHWLWRWIGGRLWRPRGFPRRLVWREFTAVWSSYRAYHEAQAHAQRVFLQHQASPPRVNKPQRRRGRREKREIM
jgi:GT2 family glycosyltransferase